MLSAGTSVVLRYLMKGSLQSLLGLGITATICSTGVFLPCLLVPAWWKGLQGPRQTLRLEHQPRLILSLTAHQLIDYWPRPHGGIRCCRICLLTFLSWCSVYLLVGAIRILVELLITSAESPYTWRHLMPSSTAIRRPWSAASYSAVLLDARKCRQRT